MLAVVWEAKWLVLSVRGDLNRRVSLGGMKEGNWVVLVSRMYVGGVDGDFEQRKGYWLNYLEYCFCCYCYWGVRERDCSYF